MQFIPIVPFPGMETPSDYIIPAFPSFPKMIYGHPVLDELGRKYATPWGQLPANLLEKIVISGTVEELQTVISLGYPLLPSIIPFGAATLQQSSALHVAINERKIDMIPILIRAGIPVDHPDSNGETPFAYACKTGRIDILEILIFHGSKGMEIPDRHGKTPIFTAVEHAQLAIFQYLADRGCHLDRKSFDGLTLFHAVVASSKDSSLDEISLFEPSNRMAILNYLLQRCPDHLNTVSAKGISPIHSALTYSDGELISQPRQAMILIERLIQAGCYHLDTPSQTGYTPLDYAIEGIIESAAKNWTINEIPLPVEECNVLIFLRALGATQSHVFDFATGEITDEDGFDSMFSDFGIYLDEDGAGAQIKEKIVKFLQTPIPLDAIQTIRNRVYFDRSLTTILLDEIRS